MHLFETLARDGRLLCPDTGQAVVVRDGRIVSPAGRDLGSIEGPLNFLRGYRDTLDPASVPPADVASMRAQLELPAGEPFDRGLAEAIAATGARFEQQHLSAEARILAERFRMPAFQVSARRSLLSKTRDLIAAMRRRMSPAPALHVDAISESVGDELTAGREVYRSIRIRNGPATLHAAARPVAKVLTEFLSPAGVAAAPAVASPLPVDLAPGREITLIVRLRPPDAAGSYRLRASFHVAGLAAQPFLEREVLVTACETPVFDYEYFPDVLEYGADHHIAMLELAGYLKERYASPACILEIGGGVHPTGHSIALQGYRVVSADISHSQSILGTLYFRHKMPDLDETLGFISCDGLALPFAEGSFDGAMLVAAFHHFADPRALLQQLKRVVRPGGFVYLGCETCAPNPADPQYREELLRGINEQMWTLAEFTAFFREAGLAAVRARVDGHSLKVTLARH